MVSKKKVKSKNGVRFDSKHIRLRTGESEKDNGTYVYRWTDKAGKRHAVYAPTLADLREQEEQIIIDRHDGIKTNVKNITVNDLFDLWVQVKRGVKDSTMKNYIYMYEMFVKPTFGKKKLTQVKKSDVRRFYNQLVDERILKISTLDGIHNVLHQVFAIAVDDDMIRNNPTDNMLRELKSAHGHEVEKRKALTVEQERIFLEYLRNSPRYNHWYPVFYIMANTGMRVGEITGLRWCDVDFKTGLINVNHTLVYYNHRDEHGCYFSINTPKTKAGIREIPMTEGVVEAFKMEKEYQEENNIISVSHIEGYSDFIFVNRFGEVQHQGTLNKALRRIMRDCNGEILENNDIDDEPVLLPCFSCHVLRHTFATRMCESGLNVKVVQSVLGHADVTTTLQIYVTVSNEMKKKGSADSIDGVFQEMYSKGEPIVSTYTATYGVPKIAFAMPMSRSLTLDGVTYTGIAVSYDTDVVDDLVDGSMYGGQSDCYVVRSNGDIVLELEPQTELCEGMTNLYDLSDHVDWKYGSMDDIRDCIQLGKSGSAQFTCDGVRNYLVAIPTAFSDWSLVGVIQTDEVDGAMLSVQQSTIIALGALCIFAVIIVVLALGMEDQLRLRREEEERLNLEREKMKSDRFLQSMSRIVDRYMVVNLDTGRYRYHELRSSEPLYPTSGQYSEMVEIISKRYVALTETENAKLSRLLTPDYLRSVLRKPDDNLKIEYCSRTENAYMVLTVLPVEWHADGTVAVVMQVVQDIGQKVELENMANTDSLTGLFNERYFSRVLNICEAKKLPFVLYYLDLDRFKPVNDTYGHAMGDRLLKEISARLLRCIRSRDYAFRIGGDEFALIVSADMDEEQRSRMAERIQTMLSAPIVIEEKVLSVGVSCGCACYPEDGDASQVRIMADSRMYAEKQHHHEDDRTEEQS